MKKLYIIGNGFDLHHKLPTNYSDYKKFLEQINIEYVKRFDDYLERYVEPNEHITIGNIKKWSSLETYTKYIYNYDLNEILEEAIASSETDTDRASFWNDIQYISTDYSRWINGIRTSFKKWIKTIKYETVLEDEKLSLDKNAQYLNFNYTETLEIVYGIPRDRILHIHGCVGRNIIFGNDEKPEKTISENILMVDTDEDADWRITEASEILNDVLRQTKLYYKDTENQIIKNKIFFEQLSECEEIVFMGFGFGTEDERYLDEICKYSKRLKKVTLFYYEKESILLFENQFLSKQRQKIEKKYIKW